jgi:hypothetical protein
VMVFGEVLRLDVFSWYRVVLEIEVVDEWRFDELVDR